jgi:endonuclease/exonuclease/phosphatase family metal-dependent hydrolase
MLAVQRAFQHKIAPATATPLLAELPPGWTFPSDRIAPAKAIEGTLDSCRPDRILVRSAATLQVRIKDVLYFLVPPDQHTMASDHVGVMAVLDLLPSTTSA